MPEKPYQKEQPGNKDYWYGELRSLGIDPKRPNDLNDSTELGNLTDNIKLTMFEDYKTAYGNEKADESRFDFII